MIAVITGDVMNSKMSDTRVWLRQLKGVLSELGSEPKNWQIYRGDSFQLEIPDAADALEKAILIKASMKMLKNIDVRLAIGMGAKTYTADKITESNGDAFVNSGTVFEQLRKDKLTMAVKSPWQDFDAEINIGLRLACAIMDRWLPNYAEVMRYTLMNRDLTQKKLGKAISIAQNTVSDRQSRAYKDELLDFEKHFRSKVTQYLAQSTAKGG
ncbi:MAG: transcriptional regulator [Gammaproteobacteria bacterium]|nr:transcriptional regulator [Gammaproteobacteria bacterium]